LIWRKLFLIVLVLWLFMIVVLWWKYYCYLFDTLLMTCDGGRPYSIHTGGNSSYYRLIQTYSFVCILYHVRYANMTTDDYLPFIYDIFFLRWKHSIIYYLLLLLFHYSILTFHHTLPRGLRATLQLCDCAVITNYHCAACRLPPQAIPTYLPVRCYLEVALRIEPTLPDFLADHYITGIYSPTYH